MARTKGDFSPLQLNFELTSLFSDWRKKIEKNNPNLNYENLKPNGMECVIRIFMNFVLLFWFQFTIVTVNKNSGFLNRIF